MRPNFYLAAALSSLWSITAFATPPLLETVLVSATRLEAGAADLPLAWSTLEPDALALVAHVHINEAMQAVPGAWISRGNGQESLTALRSPVLTGPGSCGAFYVAFDGISLRAPGFCNVNQLFDANTEQAGRIEVIKGPATALYGSNAMHGVINVLSARASGDWAQIGAEAGPDDYYRGKLALDRSGERHSLALRLNATTDGGYLEDSGYDQQKMTLRHDYQGDEWTVSSALQYANLNQETAGFITGYKAYKDSELKDTNPNPEAYRDARSILVYSAASRQLAGGSLLTLTPYYRHNRMEFLQHFVPWQPVEKNGHQSLGLRATTHLSDNDWSGVVGLDLEYTDGWLEEVQENEFSPNQPAGVHYDYRVGATVAAAYAQFDYDLAERWEFSAGARYETTRYDYDNRAGDGPACEPSADACRFFRPADRHDNFGDWSFNTALTYEFGQQLVYGRLARGFRAPQTTELYRLQAGQSSADLDSEKIDNVELGIRGQLGESFQYQLSAFLMYKDNVIFQDADRHNVSGAKTRHQGVELQLDYRFDQDWYLGAAVTNARHRYDSREQLLGSSGDIKGNDIDTAPHLFGSMRLGRELETAAGHTGRFELEWVYLDKYFLEPDNLHEYDGHSLLNLRLQAQVGENWQGALRLTNLLDEDYAERADYGFGSYRYFVGQPRGAYLEIAYRFGI